MCPYISLRLCSHADTCLSDYWSGHHLPHLAIPVRSGMSLADVQEDLKSEANQGAWAGSVDYEVTESDEFHNRAIEAIEGMSLAEGAQDGALFDHIENLDEEDGPSVMAYFVFQ